jgi:hypothetical protein
MRLSAAKKPTAFRRWWFRSGSLVLTAYESEGVGLRCGLGFGVPILGQGIRQILEAPAAPFLANSPRQTA